MGSVVQVRDNGNPIYKFLKENSLTTKSEAVFAQEYADANKAKELHSFFKENELTTKDFDGFYGQYLKPKVDQSVGGGFKMSRGFQSAVDTFDKGTVKPDQLPIHVKKAPKPKSITPEIKVANPWTDNNVAGIAKPTEEFDNESSRPEGFIDNATNFIARTSLNVTKGVVDAAHGIGTLGRDVMFSRDADNKLYNPDGSLTDYAKTNPDDIAQGLIWLKERSDELGDALGHRQLADNMVGRGMQTVSDILPDILATGLFPEIKVAQGAGVAGRYAIQAVTNPFTRVLAARKAIEGYTKAETEGGTGTDKINEAAKGAAHGVVEGSEMFLMGLMGGVPGEAAIKYAEKVGLKPGGVTKFGADLLSNYVTWGAYGAGKAIAAGDDDVAKAANDSGFLGMLFAAKGQYEKAEHNAAANSKFAKEFVDADNGLKTISLLRSTPESIKEYVELKGTAEDFHLKGLEYAEQAMKESDPEKKNQLITASSAFKKVADVKQGVEAIATDKKSWEENIDRSELPLEIAEVMKSKVNEIYKAYSPEEVKKSEIANRISEKKNAVKEKKAKVTEDPIEIAKTEIELEAVESEIRADNENLKTILKNEQSPISEILSGEEFYTMDGTKRLSSGGDLSLGVIYDQTGKAFPFNEVDVSKIKSTKAEEVKAEELVVEKTEEELNREATEAEVQSDSPITPIEEVKAVEPATRRAKRATNPKVEVEKPLPTKKAPKEEVKTEPVVEDPKAETEVTQERTLSHKEIDRITRTSTSAEPDITTKQNYQAVLKKKFGELGKSSSPENLIDKAREFVNLAHEYRSKNRIKSEKVYTEKGSKQTSNGLNYWIDSVEKLLAEKAGKSRSASQQEVTKMRSDWAKNKLSNNVKPLNEVNDPATKDNRVQELNRLNELSVKSSEITKPKSQRARKKTKFEQAINDLGTKEPNIIRHEKDGADKESSINENKDSGISEFSIEQEGLSQVGYYANGKPIYVKRGNVGDYNKFSRAIEKKLDRIKNSNYAEGSNEATERIVIKKLKTRLKEMEIKSETLEAYSPDNTSINDLLERVESKLNKLSDSGKKDLKEGRKDFGSFISPDTMIGASKIITAEIGKLVIVSAKNLDKTIEKLRKNGKIDDVVFSRISEIEKKNLLKLVKAEQERLSSGKSVGELIEESHSINEAAVKSLKRQTGVFSKRTVDKARERLWDFDGNLVKAINRDGASKPAGATAITETYGQKAERLLKTIPAAYSKAESKYNEAMNKVYGSGLFGEGKVKSLSKSEQKLMSDIANFQRIIELDTQRMSKGSELMMHPGGLDIIQAKERLAAIEAKDPSIVERFGEYDYADLKGRVDSYYEVLQGLVDYRLANGLISKRAYDVLKGVKYYSPRTFLKHLVDADGFYSNKSTISKTIHSLSNSAEGEVVTNLAKLMADAINIVYETSARNTSTKAIAELIEANPEIQWGKTASYTPDFIKKIREHQLIDKDSSPALSGANEVRVDEVSGYKYIEPSFNPAPKGYVLKTYRDKGIKRGLYLNHELARELDGLRLDGGRWLSHISGASTVTTLATGANWYFAMTNPIRDAGFALFATPHYNSFFPVGLSQYTGDFVSSLKDSFKKTGDYKKYMEQGGGNDYLHSTASLGAGSETTWKRDAKFFWDAIAHRLPSTFENAGRLAVRKRVLKNLEAEAERNNTAITPEIRRNMEEQASYAALKVLNFSEGGDLVKRYNMVTPFFNVGVIASRNLVRYARSNTKQFATKVAQLTAYVAAISAWNNGLIGSDTDMGDYYTHNISERDKASNFIIMTPIRFKDFDGNLRYLYLKIPKSQDQMIFAGAAEYGSMSLAGKESYTKEKWLKNRAFKDLQGIVSYLPDGGNLLPPIIKGVLGYTTDYDFFRDTHFTKSEEMASRKPEDQYDLNTPERWKTIAKNNPIAKSPIRLQGAFKSTVPTSNQWFDAADVIYTKVFGEDTKALAIKNQTEGTILDRFEKVMSNAGVPEEDKHEIYEGMVADMLAQAPGLKRLVKLTSPTTIDENRKDAVAQDFSKTFHDTEAMDEAALEFRSGIITKEVLMDKAKNISEDPLIVRRAISQARAAIVLKRGNADAYNIIFSGVKSDAGKAKLLFDKVNKLSQEKGLDLIKSIRSTGLFKSSFWAHYKKLEAEK